MTTFGIVLNVAANLLVAYYGWLFIFRARVVVRQAHSKYRWNFFLKPWYSIFLRCIGLFVLLLIAVTDYALLTVR
jgi:hypothetical protein